MVMKLDVPWVKGVFCGKGRDNLDVPLATLEVGING